MSNTTYNGWTNRATWAVALHLMDYITEEITGYIYNWDRDDVERAAGMFEDMFFEMYEAEGVNPLIRDLIDTNINWQELGQHALDAAFN